MIAGVASDALKVAEYRSALRLRSQMLEAGAWSSGEDEAAYKNFSRILSKACDPRPMKSLQLWQKPAPWRPCCQQLIRSAPAGLAQQLKVALLSLLWRLGSLKEGVNPCSNLGASDHPWCMHRAMLAMQIPEHTWGLDVKTFLADYSNWSNKEFQQQLDVGAWNYRYCPVKTTYLFCCMSAVDGEQDFVPKARQQSERDPLLSAHHQKAFLTPG